MKYRHFPSVHLLHTHHAMDLEQLGPYRIGRQIGRGGMGTVYAAVEVNTGTEVAVKVLSAALGREEGFRERFSAEIESLRKLNHPNIVRILGYGEQDGYQFYAMELVHGRSLEEQLHARRRFDWEEVTEIGIQVCRALKHAHDRGVIHRDIKPANLLVSDDGLIKLSDFGIAKLFGNTGMTGDGGVLGTAEYMAPEQADGRAVTQSADLYSLGGVLYTLCAGRPPFVTTSLVEMLQMQRFAEPEPLRRFAPHLPDELEDIIKSLLEKSPDRRIRNSQVLSRRLEAMRHALLRRAQRQQDAAEAGEAQPKPTDEMRPDPNAVETQLPDEQQYSRPVGDAVSATSDMSAPSADEPELAPAAQRTLPAASRFTTIEEDEHRRREMLSDELPAWISPTTWGLLLCIVGIAALAWWLLQPPSADDLYARITEAADDEQIERLVDAERHIEDFVKHYPTDPRRRQLAEYQDEIELYRLERRLDVRARRLTRSEALTPVERAYLEAINHVRLDPALGRRKLQALIDLYSGEEAPSRITSQFLELAHKQLTRLDEQMAGYAADDQQLIEERLGRADALAEEDPQAAGEIYQAVVELYADKPWAANEVQRARSALIDLGEPQVAQPRQQR